MLYLILFLTTLALSVLVYANTKDVTKEIFPYTFRNSSQMWSDFSKMITGFYFIGEDDLSYRFEYIDKFGNVRYRAYIWKGYNNCSIHYNDTCILSGTNKREYEKFMNGLLAIYKRNNKEK